MTLCRNLYLLLLIIPLLVSAQSDTDWVARYNGPGNHSDVGQAVATDVMGNVYVAAWSQDTGFPDFATIKYSRHGEQRWVARYDGTAGSDDRPCAIAVDRRGNVYVTGYGTETRTFKDYVTVKYDSFGSQRWVQRYTGPDSFEDNPCGIGVDTMGNVYVTGTSQREHGRAWVTISYDSAGGPRWQAEHGGPIGNAAAAAFSVDSAGNCWVFGKHYDADTVPEFALIKYNNAGAPQWEGIYPLPPGFSNQVGADGLARDRGGNIAVVGTLQDTTMRHLYSLTLYYNAAGVRQWDVIGSFGDVFDPSAIALDDSGRTWITGRQVPEGGRYSDFGTVVHDRQGAVIRVMAYAGPGGSHDTPDALAVDGYGCGYVTGSGYGPYSNHDYLTVKYAPDGRLLWVRCYDGTAQQTDGANAIRVDASGNVVVTGSSPGSSTGTDCATVKYAARKPWAIYVFLDGDNDLEGEAIADLNEMELAGDPNQVSLVVQLDRIPGHDASNGDWTNTRRYLVTRDTIPDGVIRSTLLEDLLERNMGSGSDLVEFFGWARSAFPADQYCLVVWDHGSGWHRSDGPPADQVCADWTDADEIKVAGEGRELAGALSQIRDDLGRKLDLLCFDACLMGMAEVDVECRDHAAYVVHSENVEPGTGFPYITILEWLSSNPEATAFELAQQIVLEYGESYREGGYQHCNRSVTLSAVDLGPEFDRFERYLGRFATELLRAGGRNRTAMNYARLHSQHFGLGGSYHDENVDLYDFASRIAADSTLSIRLRWAAQILVDSFDGAVIANTFYSDPADSSVDGAHGVSMHYPWTGVAWAYDSLLLSSNSFWDEYIEGQNSIPTEPFLAYESNTLGDYINRGELEMRVALINNGGATARGVTAEILIDDPLVQVEQGMSTFPECASDSAVLSNETYAFTVAESAALQHRVPVALVISYGAFSDTVMTGFTFIVDPARAGTGERGTGIVPEELRLTPGRPNPFRGQTAFGYALPDAGEMSLVVLDATGRRVRTLAQGRWPAGTHRVSWDGRDRYGSMTAPGVYFIELRAAGRCLRQKLVRLD